MKLFTIDDFDLRENEIDVSIIKNGEEKNEIVPRLKFENWLEKSKRLDFVSDSVDHHGDHMQDEFEIPIDQYFIDNRDGKIKEDLYDFMIENKKDFKPTHFIEQCNNIKRGSGRNEFHMPIREIGKLEEGLRYTASLFSMRTVALFKIQLKR